MTVTYVLEPTGKSAHEVAERRLTSACPTCGADWTTPGNGLPRGPARCYLCTACQQVHPAQLVDSDGRPVASLGWGLTQQLRDEGTTP